MRDPRVEHVARLIQNVAYLERLNEARGPTRYRIADIAAIGWVLETIQDLDPDLREVVADAEKLAEDRLSRMTEVSYR